MLLDDALDVMFGAIRTPEGPVLFTTPVWAGSADAGPAHIGRVRSLGDPVIDDVARRPPAEVVRAAGESFPHGGNYRLGSRIQRSGDQRGFVALRAAPSGPVVQRVRDIAGEGEVLPQTGAFQCQVGSRGIAHQPQVTVLLSSEVVGFEQHLQPSGSQEMHTIKVHYHESSTGQLCGENGG